jgi:hypothetical protein
MGRVFPFVDDAIKQCAADIVLRWVTREIGDFTCFPLPVPEVFMGWRMRPHPG